MFNDEPPAGNDYLAVQLAIQYKEGPEDKPFTLSDGGTRLYAGNKLWGAPSMGIPPDPAFAGQDLFPGAEHAGWLPPKYLPIELQDEAVLVYDGLYFALK